MMKSQILILSLLGMTGSPSFAQSNDTVAKLEHSSKEVSVNAPVLQKSPSEGVSNPQVQLPMSAVPKSTVVITNQSAKPHVHRIGLPGLFHINIP